MRVKALTIRARRKQEYLGARVLKELKKKVIKHAAELKIPVSHLILRMAEGEFGGSAFGGESPGPITAAAMARGGNGTISVHKYPKVLGWGRVRQNRGTTCKGRDINIEPGVCATLVLPMQGEKSIILCDVCSESL